MTAKGTKLYPVKLDQEPAVHVCSGLDGVAPQLRRHAATERHILAPSFKSALALIPEQALGVASHLATVAGAALSPSASADLGQ